MRLAPNPEPPAPVNATRLTNCTTFHFSISAFFLLFCRHSFRPSFPRPLAPARYASLGVAGHGFYSSRCRGTATVPPHDDGDDSDAPHEARLGSFTPALSVDRGSTHGRKTC